MTSMEAMALCLMAALLLASLPKTVWTLLASGALMTVASGLALANGTMQPMALSLPAMLLGCAFWVRQSAWGWSWMLVLAAATLLHLWPGIHNPIWVTEQTLGASTTPYRQFLNIDKAWLGFTLLIALRGEPAWRSERRIESGLAIGLASLILLAAVAGSWLRFDPSADKLALLLRWASVNLLLTCLVEETVFRHGIQRQLGECWQRHHRHGRTFALLVASAVFGLAHAGGGVALVVLASLAGLAYGLAYRRHGLWGATLLHFGLNASHFLLLSYPA